MEQKILLNSPLFTGITPQEAQTMLSCLCAKERSVPADYYLLREGDTVTHIGLLLEGEVQIAQTDYWGNTNILNMLAPGDVFGEVYACRPTEPIRFYAQAKCPCRVLFLDIGRVIHTCTNACVFHERLVRNLLFIVAGKALELAKKTSHLSHRSTREKLLSYLCEEGRGRSGESFTIPFNRQQLADYLCVDRSALSKEMGCMQRENILTYEKNRFRLL